MNKSLHIYVWVVALLCGLLAACTHTDDVSTPLPTRIMFANVVPNAAFDIYSNSEKLVTNLPFDSATAFASGDPRIYSFSVMPAGTSTELISGIQSLQSGLSYTMFLVPDTTGTAASPKLSSAILTNSYTLPSIDTTKIRFLDFAPYTKNLNITFSIIRPDSIAPIPQDTIHSFTGRYFNDQVAYSSVTAFKWLPIGRRNINVLYNPDNVHIDTLIAPVPYDFSDRYTNYTIVLTGYPDSTGNARLQLKVFADKYQ